MTAYSERPEGPGITRQLLATGPGGQVTRLRFAAGANRPPHNVGRQRSLLVQSGRFRVWIDDDMFELGPGGTAIVPPEAVHAYLCLEPGALIEVL